jgi:ATP-dependent Clp protease ATP-binding subunit ClpC
MFERFTDRARRVLALAQAEARLLNHNFIGTEHLLLGLIHEGEGVAARALDELEITLEGVRERVEETIAVSGKSAAGSPLTPREKKFLELSRRAGTPPFTPRMRKVLELSLREALRLNHDFVDTEHMLLGIAREGEGVATRVLVSMGADLVRVRQQVLSKLPEYEGKEPEEIDLWWPPPTVAGHRP